MWYVKRDVNDKTILIGPFESKDEATTHGVYHTYGSKSPFKVIEGEIEPTTKPEPGYQTHPTSIFRGQYFETYADLVIACEALRGK